MKTVDQKELIRYLRDVSSGIIAIKNQTDLPIQFGDLARGKGHEPYGWIINKDIDELNDITTKLYHSDFKDIFFYIHHMRNNEKWGNKLIKIAVNRRISNGIVLFQGLSDLHVQMLEENGIEVLHYSA